MAQIQHLRNAPIVEAIINLRVVAETRADPKSLDRSSDLAKLGLSEVEPVHQVSGRFTLDIRHDKSGASHNRILAGYRHKSDDGKYHSVFASDEFGFSRLHPYTNWNDVFSKALACWHVYEDAVSPQSITRAAVRFINRLELPFVNELDEYLIKPARIPGDLAVTGYLTRFAVREPRSGIRANLTQSLEMRMVDGARQVVIMLDNDVFKLLDSVTSEEALRKVFDELHDMKNRIFFESITEKTAEVYK